MPILSFLELVETSIVIMLTDMGRTSQIRELLGKRLKYFNESDVTQFMKRERKSEALALIYEHSGNIPEALE